MRHHRRQTLCTTRTLGERVEANSLNCSKIWYVAKEKHPIKFNFFQDDIIKDINRSREDWYLIMGSKHNLIKAYKDAITSMGWGSRILLYLNREVQTLEDEVWLGWKWTIREVSTCTDNKRIIANWPVKKDPVKPLTAHGTS